MTSVERKQLYQEIYKQLERYGLLDGSKERTARLSKTDLSAIRLTVERVHSIIQYFEDICARIQLKA